MIHVQSKVSEDNKWLKNKTKYTQSYLKDS